MFRLRMLEPGVPVIVKIIDDEKCDGGIKAGRLNIFSAGNGVGKSVFQTDDVNTECPMCDMEKGREGRLQR